MKKEIAEKWVAALRSGEYKQGTHKLRNRNNEFCCLGVLCELAVKEGVISEAQPSFDHLSQVQFYEYGMDQAGISNKSVQEWSGLKDSMGKFSLETKKRTGVSDTGLAFINDQGLAFDKIADFIEQNYEEL